MDVILVSGFLGAGKTTLINHLLSSGAEGKGKLALIVNEVGEFGVDGALLSGRDVDMIELAGGCICCTIRTNFFNAVQEIYDSLHPDFLVVEATGVAQPGEILDVLFDLPQSEFIRPRSLITVVDAGFFKAREVLGSFYDNQIRFADILILNKADQVEAGTLREIQALLQEMNPESILVPARYCAVDISLLFDRNYGDEGRRQPHAGHGQGDHGNRHCEEGGFQSFSFRDQRPLDREKLIQFLESLPPDLFRLKGWVRYSDASGFLNFTGGRYRIEPADNSYTTALAFVGRDCNKAAILRALNDCLIKEPDNP